MNSGKLQSVFNAFSVLSSGMLAGVMLAIGITLGGYWKSIPPEDFLAWFSKNSHFIMNSTGAVTLATFIGLPGSLWTSRKNRKVRQLWMLSLTCFTAIITITFTVEVPINAQFVKGLPAQDVAVLLNRWLIFHSIRIVLATIMTITGIMAIGSNVTVTSK